MGDPLQGRYASVKLDTNLIANLGSWNIDVNLDTIDVSVFGSVWGKSIPGMQHWTGSVEGFYDPADANGQAALQADALASTKITDIKFYIDAVSYWTPDVTNDTEAGCYINTLSIKHDKAGVAAVTYSIIGFGALTLV